MPPAHGGRPGKVALLLLMCGCVPGGSVDVNLLLTQLLAKGLIAQKDSSQPSSLPPPASVTSDVAADAAAVTDACDVCLSVCVHYDF